MTKLPTRLIIDPPQPGAWNMAVDEALLESAIERRVATLRFYQWSEPTLSLGYFQKIADRELHPASLGCPVVRRHSGGGAILHDREITYSLALPPGAPQVREAEQVYRQVHEALLATLAKLAPEVALRSSANLCSEAIPHPAGAEPFLCFQRRARCDVLLAPAEGSAHTVDGRHKICGSAQRKRCGALLQHGSLLLQPSPSAPELPGLRECVPLTLSVDNCSETWAAKIKEILGLSLKAGEIDAGEQERAETIQQQQFAAEAWTARR